MQRQTTNVGVLLELGETPLSFTGTRNAIKNWVRICTDATCNKLVISSYENCITNNLSWPAGIKDTFSRIGMLDKFLNKDDTAYVSSFQRICDIFHQNTFHEIKKESNKLRTYNLLKTQIGYENYLSKIENIQHRIAFTKFRLSNHCLEIEKGRHQRIDKNNRFCPFCPKSREDENHFLLQCEIYKILRETLFVWAETQISNFSHWDYPEKIINLMTNSIYMKKTASLRF